MKLKGFLVNLFFQGSLEVYLYGISYLCAMLLRISSKNIEWRKIRQVAEVLKNGGIIIYPTDTIYGLGCDINNQKAVEKICQLRNLDHKTANLSFICKDIGQVAEYAKTIDNQTFRILKKNLPGPFTFILSSSNAVPKLFKNKKRTIGIRIPDHPIPLAIVEELGRPILTTSLRSDDEILEYFTDPQDIYEDFKKRVDAFIDGGYGSNVPSTVVNLSNGEPELIREGMGEFIY
jgi:tRNA threonylcarbamoyl adenosine modification protein (Sua5/YciO/YrdC/YwlC family)